MYNDFNQLTGKYSYLSDEVNRNINKIAQQIYCFELYNNTSKKYQVLIRYGFNEFLIRDIRKLCIPMEKNYFIEYTYNTIFDLPFYVAYSIEDAYKKEKQKSNNKRIAVDFDGTLDLSPEEQFPYPSKPNKELFKVLIEKQKQGDKIILNTLREGIKLDMAVAFCKYNGLEFDKINDNLEEDINLWGENTRKISADIYIDDRNKSIEEYIKENK